MTLSNNWRHFYFTLNGTAGELVTPLLFEHPKCASNYNAQHPLACVLRAPLGQLDASPIEGGTKKEIIGLKIHTRLKLVLKVGTEELELEPEDGLHLREE